MGVKSLWQLLEPVGRPVLLETMEGKSMAIDSSIWIYQFQATMRDKEGRGLVNAHVLGFLRRICKLLFYGIKPVFVFDGGAPALKMSTIAERKNKKSGAAASHAKIAERLLAAQMRREALEQTVGKTPDPKGKGRAPSGRIDDDTVFLEDLTGPAPITPAAKKSPKKSPKDAQATPPSSKKSRWKDHDPYKLPDVNMEEAVARAAAAVVPDPRLATEEELQTFIDEMRPEDFDVTSPAFRELPTEVQYEIIGDLRLKSRQTSYKRLQSMLRNARTPLDFSKEQIRNLKQRNALTQQLLVTTDSIGKANITIPIRIASERNKQYVLVKNEGEAGGWVLGIRDEGTAAKPIEIDPTPVAVEDSDEDDDMEEVPISTANPIEAMYDPDLREFRRGQALAALAARNAPRHLAPLTTKVVRKRKARPLFEPEADELPQLGDVLDDDIEDPALLLAIQESLDLEEEASLQRALEESRLTASHSGSSRKSGESSTGGVPATPRPPTSIDRRRSQQFHARSESDDEDLYASPTRLETALSIGGAAPRRPPMSKSKSSGSTAFPVSSTFGLPTLLLPDPPAPASPKDSPIVVSESEDDMEEVLVQPQMHPLPLSIEASPEPAAQPSPPPQHNTFLPPSPPAASEAIVVNSDSDEDMEEILPAPSLPESSLVPTDEPVFRREAAAISAPPAPGRSTPIRTVVRTDHSTTNAEASSSRSPARTSPRVLPSRKPPTPPVAQRAARNDVPSSESESDDDYVTHAPSPSAHAVTEAARRAQEAGAGAEEDWDAAQELDVHAEEGEFARFISQVKGKDIDAVRREIDDEIRELNRQKKTAMRDAEDVTHQMVSQIMIMLRLFGIPYITAPMEAEAQCAALLSLGLVDGIITDDSDVFLFGGGRVLKNMFNQSKTVECFLLSDLERELGLDRDKLVRLAYLLGSDYTDGLPGVGPVVAMELMSEFPGQDGLHKFKAWWQKVQSGRDKQDESASRFRKRFKKKFKELYLPSDWPNPAVRDAYYHPTVDDSKEHFKWGMPDLDALRNFFDAELGWDQAKVDDLLLPIIHKMSKRSQNAAAPTMQGNLAAFLDLPAGANAAPRKRQAYTSKRLQQVVQDFRKQQAKQRGSPTPAPLGNGAGSGSDYEDGEKAAERPAKKRKTTKAAGKGKGKAREAAGQEDGAVVQSSARGGRGRGRGRGRGGAKRTSRKRGKSPSDNEEEADDDMDPAAQGEPSGAPTPSVSREELGLRPRPKPRPVFRKPALPEVGEDQLRDNS
ncbi:hypothetical protein C2E23DRAFT_907659 [Lenzites betulinus]|nr:hypothetical protein C2E23DRAFT_907659 [Lenzites betulinus]